MNRREKIEQFVRKNVTSQMDLNTVLRTLDARVAEAAAKASSYNGCSTCVFGSLPGGIKPCRDCREDSNLHVSPLDDAFADDILEVDPEPEPVDTPVVPIWDPEVLL